MTRHNRLAIAALLVSGCAGPDPTNFAYVVLDGPARRAGIEVQSTWGLRAPVLPTAIDTLDDDTVQLTHATAGPLRIAPGEVLWVRGARGSAERLRLGVDVAEDMVLLRSEADGDDGDARALATLLDGDLVVGDDGERTLRAPDLWSRLADLEVPATIVEAQPLRASAAFRAPTAMTGDVGDLRARALADVVGLYRSEQASVLLDAAGGATLFGAGCAPSVRGHFELYGNDGVLSLDGAERIRVILADGDEMILVPSEGALASDRLGRLGPVEDVR